VSSPLEIPQTPILDSTEPSFLKFKIQQFEQLIKNSPLMSLRLFFLFIFSFYLISINKSIKLKL